MDPWEHKILHRLEDKSKSLHEKISTRQRRRGTWPALPRRIHSFGWLSPCRSWPWPSCRGDWQQQGPSRALSDWRLKILTWFFQHVRSTVSGRLTWVCPPWHPHWQLLVPRQPKRLGHRNQALWTNAFQDPHGLQSDPKLAAWLWSFLLHHSPERGTVPSWQNCARSVHRWAMS